MTTEEAQETTKDQFIDPDYLYPNDDDEYKLIHEFKNVYNKMIMYDASTPHGTTKFVDDRLSIVFFVKELSVIN